MSGPAAPEAVLRDTVEALSGGKGPSFDAVEAFAKQGRSRRIALNAEVPTTIYAEEQGWAVRASNRRGSFFASGTGALDPAGPWPEADGYALTLPAPVTAPDWREPADVTAPLVGEREALALLSAIAKALAEELPGARLLHGSLEDGAAETQIVNSRGVAARYRSRLASLRLEAVGPRGGRSGESTGPARPVASLHLAEREARRLNPLAVARRLADRLSILAEGRPRSRDRGEFLLAPPVMAHLLNLLRPLFVGPGAHALAEDLADGRGRLAAEAVTLLDDGRLHGGALQAPVDGEGVATRETLLVDRGTFRQPLLDWRSIPGEPRKATGCCRRSSWRDLPRPAPSHLFLRPKSGISVAELLGSVQRGYYLVDVAGTPTMDWSTGRFTLPVCGLEIRAGRAAGAMAGSRLCGSAASLLRGVNAAARDLSFLPFDGMMGSPTVLVTGLELRAGSGLSG